MKIKGNATRITIHVQDEDKTLCSSLCLGHNVYLEDCQLYGRKLRLKKDKNGDWIADKRCKQCINDFGTGVK